MVVTIYIQLERWQWVLWMKLKTQSPVRTCVLWLAPAPPWGTQKLCRWNTHLWNNVLLEKNQSITLHLDILLLSESMLLHVTPNTICYMAKMVRAIDYWWLITETETIQTKSVQLSSSVRIKQGKSERFVSCDRPSILTQIGFKSSIFLPVWPWNLMDDLEKLQGTSSRLHQALCIILNPSVNSNWSYCPETLNSGQNQRFVVPCDLKIWRMTLKNNRTPLLCCFKLCASFHSHRWIQTKVTVRKRSIRVKIVDLLSRVTFLKFDGWPWKTIGHLFYVASSFMHHSGNAQSGSNSTLFRAVWPWHLTDDLEKQ